MTGTNLFAGPSRIDTSDLARWWWSIDRVTLGIVAAIIMIGAVLMLAAGPGAATRLGIDDSFHFSLRQMVFLGPAIALMAGVSMLSPLGARRIGVVTFAIALPLVMIAAAFAPVVNGSQRWLYFASFGLQPSEFLKPGFVIVAAWMLAERAARPQFPGAAIAGGLFLLAIGALVAQPDYGQTALLTAVFGVMIFVAGLPILWLGAIAATGLATLYFGYRISPHIADRIDAFFNPKAGDNYQIDKALEAIANGGVGGRSGEGASVKLSLPDAHTDFIFAVAGEEFGLVFCLFILSLFALFVVRTAMQASRQKSMFAQLAVIGLGAMIGLQSFVNMAVNVRAVPAKGLTLPFISYGGSSLLATGLAIGLVLSLTRKRGHARRRREIMP